MYLVYRHTLDFGKISGQHMELGPLRDLGLTADFDLNSKEDAGYNSRKRMRGGVDLHFMGATVHIEVPGFLDMSLLELWESNALQDKFADTPHLARYSYRRRHQMLNLAWGKLRAGVAYQYWRNKFGNPASVVGSSTRTPMLRLDYHL